ncbi:MAG: hypothetical protein KDG50_04100 [Chromatiales bacterium]|nr:hypothetical protein [Chromatiales bacterium]
MSKTPTTKQPDQQPTADHVVESRRKLLRGLAAGVPAIATLHVGPSAAVSFVDGTAKCFNNIQDAYTNNPNVPPQCVTAVQAGTELPSWIRDPEGNFQGGGPMDINGDSDTADYCLLYFDENGNELPSTEFPYQSGGYPITASCLTSFVVLN